MQRIDEPSATDEFSEQEHYQQSEHLKAAREKLIQKHEIKKQIQKVQPWDKQPRTVTTTVIQNDYQQVQGALNSKVNSYKAMIQSQPAYTVYEGEIQMKPFTAINSEEIENYKGVVYKKIQSLLQRLDSEQDLDQMKKVLDTIEHFRKVYTQL